MKSKHVPAPPRYTQIPNTVLDNLAAFSESELKVYLAILRATLGYHRRSRKMSLSYLTEATGLSKTSVVSAVQSLAENGLVRRVQDGNSYAYEPLFYEENGSKSEHPKGKTVQNLDTNGSKSGQKTVQNLDTIKEKRKKERKKKRSASQNDVPSSSSQGDIVVTPWGPVDPSFLDENRKRVLAAMQEGYTRATVHSLAADFPEHLRPLAAWCIQKCGKPTKAKKADWIKSLNLFYNWGATPEDMETAFANAYRLGYRVTRPGSLEKFVNQAVNARKYQPKESDYAVGVKDPFADNAPPLDAPFDF